MLKIGNRRQVINGIAEKTGGGLKKKDLKYNKFGKIVSKKMSNIAKKENRLQKAGYYNIKGQFGSFKMEGGSNNRTNMHRKVTNSALTKLANDKITPDEYNKIMAANKRLALKNGIITQDEYDQITIDIMKNQLNKILSDFLFPSSNINFNKKERFDLIEKILETRNKLFFSNKSRSYFMNEEEKGKLLEEIKKENKKKENKNRYDEDMIKELISEVNEITKKRFDLIKKILIKNSKLNKMKLIKDSTGSNQEYRKFQEEMWRNYEEDSRKLFKEIPGPPSNNYWNIVKNEEMEKKRDRILKNIKKGI